jgi:hypothetical protein
LLDVNEKMAERQILREMLGTKGEFRYGGRHFERYGLAIWPPAPSDPGWQQFTAEAPQFLENGGSHSAVLSYI